MQGIEEVIKNRRSVRRFKPDPVPGELLKKVLEAARWAPSAGNVQPWKFFVVTSPAKKEALAAAALGQRFVAEAPVVVVVCALLRKAAGAYGARGKELYCLQDTAAATQNMLLMATALGLGGCWVGAFREEEVKKALGLEGDVRPVALVPLGYPQAVPSPPPRLPLEEITVQDC